MRLDQRPAACTGQRLSRDGCLLPPGAFWGGPRCAHLHAMPGEIGSYLSAGSYGVEGSVAAVKVRRGIALPGGQRAFSASLRLVDFMSRRPLDAG